MRGKPKNNNFKVVNLETNEMEEFKTFQDIANKYKTTYCTIYNLYKINTKKNKIRQQKKLLKLSSQIEILDIDE